MTDKQLSKQAILFDLDGTLLDTRALILESMRYTMRVGLGKTYPDAELLDEVGIPLRDMMLHFDASRADELVDIYRSYSFSVEHKLIADFAGTHQALEQLRRQDMRMVVVTSKRNDQALSGLARFELTDFFEFVIGADDTDKHKPQPEPLLLGARRLGVPAEQCVYLGDSPYDMQAAKSANMLAVAALWGMFPAERLLAAGAQHQLSCISELPEFLTNIHFKS